MALVAAFATRAPLLVLDEPTSGLDPLMEREFRRCIAEAAERGQTVFLSSHQLAEVEAVCSRVGILRTGRLVEVAGLDDLRRLRRSEVIVDLAGRPRSCERLAEPAGGGRPAVDVADLRLTLSLTGPPGPVLRALGDADVAAARRPRAVARGDLPRLLRGGRGMTAGTAPRAPAPSDRATRPSAAAGRGRSPATAVRQVRRGTRRRRA